MVLELVLLRLILGTREFLLQLLEVAFAQDIDICTLTFVLGSLFTEIRDQLIEVLYFIAQLVHEFEHLKVLFI